MLAETALRSGSRSPSLRAASARTKVEVARPYALSAWAALLARSPAKRVLLQQLAIHGHLAPKDLDPEEPADLPAEGRVTPKGKQSAVQSATRWRSAWRRTSRAGRRGPSWSSSTRLRASRGAARTRRPTLFSAV